ncbi:MAG: chemotaxis protein CheX [Candidatus Dadabacteria bacterium]|nr:MAG: chemotaxis protein CheX [Candidatus Dadabacteria bacterium]
MEARFINPFLSATVEALKTMANLEVVRGSPSIETSFQALADVSGLIGITGDVQGAVALSFPFALARRICEALVGESVADGDPAIGDAAGELANIVTGGVKRAYDKLGVRFQLSTPTVAVGERHKILYPSDRPVLVIPFRTLGTPFWVQATLKFEGRGG